MNSRDKLIESLEAIKRRLTPLTKNGEDNIWRPACAAVTAIHLAASELSRRASRIEELEKALAPFAAAYVMQPNASDHDLSISFRPTADAPDAITLDWSHFRAARQALSDHPDKEGGK